MRKISAITYLAVWIGIAIGKIGEVANCEPFPANTPIEIGIFLGFGMILAYLAGQGDSE